ncbi:MAG: AraC family transcriptional regulator [Planctomycetota bacterium]|nr:AraC family transcriptional regulator [Planctomycetota bacterium]MCX8040732.1 AraC family transcriptional regulator [Planctomycetota bacterium]MDW8372385.1 AraC family transcriptional regulator [Planctomycetota bacterium]
MLRLARQGLGIREQVVADPGSSLRSLVNCGDHWPFTWHYHPELELTAVERGQGVRAVGDSIAPFAAGDVVLIGSAVPHSWASEPGLPGGVQAVVVQFPAELLAATAEAARLRQLAERACLGLCGPPTAVALVRAIHEARAPLRRLARLLEVLAEAEQWTPLMRPVARRHHRDPRLQRALAWLDQHAREPLRLGELASRVAMRPPALSRAFRTAYGITPSEYVARLRIGLCCRELAESDAEVAAIAFANGFGSLASFHRWFRRLTGSSPELWRRRLRG